MSSLDYPDDLQYTAEHEWVRVAGGRRRSSGSASPTSPRTRSATSSTSRCRRSAPRSPPGEPAARSSRPRASATSTPRSSGEVIARNEALDATPELVNTDPYGEGWLFELRPADADAVDGLLDAAAYREPDRLTPR